MISQFGFLLLFFIAALLFVFIVLIIAKIFRPNKPNPEKNAIYESGEESEGSAHVSFNIRFYIVALVFLLFDVELVLLFPWATVFGNETLIKSTNGQWAWYAGIEMFIFVFVLALGLVYAWKKGHLDWIKPVAQKKEFKSPVTETMYKEFNKRY